MLKETEHGNNDHHYSTSTVKKTATTSRQPSFMSFHFLYDGFGLGELVVGIFQSSCLVGNLKLVEPVVIKELRGKK